MNTSQLYKLPKELIIKLLVNVHDNYRLSNLSLEELEKLEEEVEMELSKLRMKELKEKLFNNPETNHLQKTIDQLCFVEKKRDCWFLKFATPELVNAHIYPCSKNLFFISDKYPNFQRYHLYDRVDRNFSDSDIMELVQIIYESGYLTD